MDELRPGAEMTFRFEQMPLEGMPTTITGRVTEFDPPRLFAFYWGDDHLRFELEPRGRSEDACLLRLTVLLDTREKAARDSAGWHVCLDRLEARLGGIRRVGRGRGLARALRGVPAPGAPAGAPIPGE